MGGPVRPDAARRHLHPRRRHVSGIRAVPGARSLANPGGILPFTNRVATEGEVAYARFADTTPHIVLSTTRDAVTWRNTRVVRDLEAIRRLKQQPGSAMHAVGGATLVSSLMTAGLVDELQLVVRPIVLGGGTALFKDVTGRHALRLLESTTVAGDLVRLTYRVQP